MDQLVIFAAKYLFVVVPITAAILFLLLPRREKIKFIALSTLSLPLSLSIAKLLNKLIINPRPFVANNTQPLLPHAPDNGFPSDHALLVATVAAIVFAFNKKLGIGLMVIAILVGAARVIAQIHHPVDILGSIVISVVVTYLCGLFVRRFNLKLF